jgi:hypothetical protein
LRAWVLRDSFQGIDWDEVTDFRYENHVDLMPESKNLRRSAEIVPE